MLTLLPVLLLGTVLGAWVVRVDSAARAAEEREAEWWAERMQHINNWKPSPLPESK